jgi:alkylation response protein AidB-like acyl-CoA dehydrogenase
MRERFSPVSRKPDFGELFGFVRELDVDGVPALRDPAIQERLAEWYVRSEAIRFTRLRIMTSLSRGETPGPIGSIIKLAEPIKVQDMADFALDLLGPGGAEVGSSDELRKLFEEAFIYSAALRIAGGTDEIQHNIVAERVLGMPADFRFDKGIPFLDIPTGPKTGATERSR